MGSFFENHPSTSPPETTRSLPPEIRQFMIDLRMELPTMSLREIAEICAIRFNRRPSHHTLQMVLASSSPPSINARRYQTWEKIPYPAQPRPPAHPLPAHSSLSPSTA